MWPGILDVTKYVVSTTLDDSVFARKYAFNGETTWTRQFGTSSGDIGLGVATDGEGNAFVGGSTSGALEGSSAGKDDVFVRGYRQ